MKRLVRSVLCVCLAACSRKEEPTPLGTTASALEPPKPAPGSMLVHFEVQKDGKASVFMDKAEKIKADTSVSAGKLDVDLMDLTRSVGEVRVDLTSLKTHTFGDSQDASQTAHALNWMEIGDEFGKETRDKFQWAVFSIRSIDGASEKTVSKVAPKTEGGDDVRTVTFTAHGELLIHGLKVNKEVPMEARFHTPAGATPETKPSSIVFATKGPMKVTLKEHDVRPRSTTGQLLDWTARLTSKVAEQADVTLEMTAKPSP